MTSIADALAVLGDRPGAVEATARAGTALPTGRGSCLCRNLREHVDDVIQRSAPSLHGRVDNRTIRPVPRHHRRLDRRLSWISPDQDGTLGWCAITPRHACEDWCRAPLRADRRSSAVGAAGTDRDLIVTMRSTRRLRRAWSIIAAIGSGSTEPVAPTIRTSPCFITMGPNISGRPSDGRGCRRPESAAPSRNRAGRAALPRGSGRGRLENGENHRARARSSRAGRGHESGTGGVPGARSGREDLLVEAGRIGAFHSESSIRESRREEQGRTPCARP